ncbi:hypothetical protein [Actinotalea sp. K2]|uniref:hypothetical protein n=1 Tax=Actinotalea sp. K2 TaxID=2939438 RepID=UPI0020183123|nr:hypothetical protein [Actinotalea sp. K2]MCL3859454.1 hypothetical protein [Actinotalea sp. K2]
MFLPVWYDVLWSLVVLAQVGLLAAALTLWFRRRHDHAGGLLDLVVILVVPLIGPAAYLAGSAPFRTAVRSRAESGSV